jgi:hypothetical protein
MRLLRASLVKLARRPATSRTLLILVGFVALIYVAIGLSVATMPDPSARESLRSFFVFPDAAAGIASVVLIFGGMAGAAYAGTVAASEWSWNTFRVALTRGESRVGYVTFLLVAIALLAALGWLVLFVVGIGAALVAATLGGFVSVSPLDPTSIDHVGAILLTGGWALLMEVAIGFAVSFVTRSAVAGVATVAALYFIEQLAALVVPVDVMRFAPVTSGSAMVSAAALTGFDVALVGSFLVTSAYIIVAVGAAALVARRAQVS